MDEREKKLTNNSDFQLFLHTRSCFDSSGPQEILKGHNLGENNPIYGLKQVLRCLKESWETFKKKSCDIM